MALLRSRHSGIGGAVAEVVGKKLRAIGAERSQVRTHLPPVAGQGINIFRYRSRQ